MMISNNALAYAAPFLRVFCRSPALAGRYRTTADLLGLVFLRRLFRKSDGYHSSSQLLALDLRVEERLTFNKTTVRVAMGVQAVSVSQDSYRDRCSLTDLSHMPTHKKSAIEFTGGGQGPGPDITQSARGGFTQSGRRSCNNNWRVGGSKSVPLAALPPSS